MGTSRGQAKAKGKANMGKPGKGPKNPNTKLYGSGRGR